MAKDSHRNLIGFGVWAWGLMTAVLAAGALALVVAAGCYLGIQDRFAPDCPKWLAGIYFALKENGTLVAGILGFSGLAWSHFFVAATSARNSN